MHKRDPRTANGYSLRSLDYDMLHISGVSRRAKRWQIGGGRQKHLHDAGRNHVCGHSIRNAKLRVAQPRNGIRELHALFRQRSHGACAVLHRVAPAADVLRTTRRWRPSWTCVLRKLMQSEARRRELVCKAWACGNTHVWHGVLEVADPMLARLDARSQAVALLLQPIDPVGSVL